MPDKDGYAKWRITYKVSDRVDAIDELQRADLEEVAVHLLRTIIRRRAMEDVTRIEIEELP